MKESKYKTIGILGGGQLGRFLVLSARKLGFRTIVLDPTENSPAGQVANEQIVGSFDDSELIQQVSKKSDCLLFEIESVNTPVLLELEKKGVRIFPSPKVLANINDKYLQKEFLTNHSIPTAESKAVESLEDVTQLGEEWGFPIVLKARMGAYDGRGNTTITSVEDIGGAWQKLSGKKLYVEKWIPFVKELAVVATQDDKGNVALYPTVETIHVDHICDTVIAPAQIREAHAKKAEGVALSVLKALESPGVFGIEMFLLENGDVLVNEIAPRVHNSGHFSLDGAETSQFEQHIRILTGLPLGNVDMKASFTVMKNILGTREGEVSVENVEKLEKGNGVFIHMYGKLETRPQRKMGHINVVGDEGLDSLRALAEHVRSQIDI